MKIITLMLILLPVLALGSEKECMAAIMHSEASGESLPGIIAVGQASLNRSKVTKRSVCTIKGVTRRSPPPIMAKYYLNLAAAILDGGESVVGSADSWERAKKPRYAGRINRRIGHHTFYTSKRLG